MVTPSVTRYLRLFYFFVGLYVAFQLFLHGIVPYRNTPQLQHKIQITAAKLAKYEKEWSNPYNKTCHFEFLAAPDGLGVSYDVSLFYHIGMLNNWRQIVHDQFDTLEHCGLGYIASGMTISFQNPSPNVTESESIQQILELLNQYHFATHFLSNVTFLNAAMSSPHERLIMEFMSLRCRQSRLRYMNKTQIMFYFHDKGCSKYAESEEYTNILYWRKYMEWFLLERPTLCIRAILNHGSKTCGVELREWPSMHYSGNFWSASCDYIVDLPDKEAWPDATNDWSHYVSAEMWIGNYTNRKIGDEIKFLTLFNIVAILYHYRATPDVYTWILSDRAFYEGNHSSFIQIPGWEGCPDCNKGCKPGNQTEIWEDYLFGLEGIQA